MKKKVIGFGLALCMGAAMLLSNMGMGVVNATENTNKTLTQPSTTTASLDNNAKFTVNGKELVVTENLNPNKYPTGFSETKVTCKDKKYKGLKFNKADIYMVCLLNQQSGAAAYYIYKDDTQSVYPFIQIKDGTNYIFALSSEFMDDTQIPDSLQETELEFEKGTVAAYQEASPQNAASYLIYAMNQDGEKNWYEYNSDDKTYSEYTQSSEEVSSDNEEAEESDSNYLGEKYTQLEEKYDKEKTTYRIIIAIMLFLIAVLFVFWINTLLKVRQYKQLDDEEEIMEPEELESEELEEEELEESEEDYDEEEILEEPQEPQEELIQKPKKEYDSEIEVLDLNDL